MRQQQRECRRETETRTRTELHRIENQMKMLKLKGKIEEKRKVRQKVLPFLNFTEYLSDVFLLSEELLACIHLYSYSTLEVYIHTYTCFHLMSIVSL